MWCCSCKYNSYSSGSSKNGTSFALAVEAGREAFLAKIAEEKKYASASSPLTGFLSEVTNKWAIMMNL